MAHMRRAYGSDDGLDAGPEPCHIYPELLSGPLDGLLLDVTGWTEDMLTGGAYLMAPLSA